jgi:hypothetical protein
MVRYVSILVALALQATKLKVVLGTYGTKIGANRLMP